MAADMAKEKGKGVVAAVQGRKGESSTFSFVLSLRTARQLQIKSFTVERLGSSSIWLVSRIVLLCFTNK